MQTVGIKALSVRIGDEDRPLEVHGAALFMGEDANELRSWRVEAAAPTAAVGSIILADDALPLTIETVDGRILRGNAAILGPMEPHLTHLKLEGVGALEGVD